MSKLFPYEFVGRTAGAAVLTVTLAEALPHHAQDHDATAAWGLSPAQPVRHEHTPERHYSELGRINAAYYVTSTTR